MYGSILGDMCGAPYEFCLIKTTDFNFQPSFFTDDTVLTVAVAHALMSCGEENNPEKIKESLIQSMQYFGRKYDNVGYSPAFYSWLLKRKPKPYNSYGNGSAMRCGAIAYFYPEDLVRALEVAKLSAEISHNHPEGIKGAVAVTELIWKANAGEDKYELKRAASKYYELGKTCDEIRVDYKFDVSCQGTVPVAIQCFLEGNNYEEVVKLAISMGGDSDTLGAISGSIAEEYFAYDPDEYYASLQMGLPALYYSGRENPPHPEIWINYFLRMMELYSKKVYELSKTSENDELDGSLSYLNAKEKEFLAFLLKKRLYEFTPIEVSKMLGVTNKTIINRCAKLVNNGLLIPIIVKTRVRSYRLSDFSKTNEKKILKKIS